MLNDNAMEKIYYALGELAYLVAAVDGKVQIEEVEKLHELVIEEIKKKHNEFQYSDIIFNVLKAEKIDLDHVYKSAFDELRNASNYFTEDVKAQFLSVLNSVAESFDGIDSKEASMLKKIEEDLSKI